jgi:hypothetical protein
MRINQCCENFFERWCLGRVFEIGHATVDFSSSEVKFSGHTCTTQGSCDFVHLTLEAPGLGRHTCGLLRCLLRKIRSIARPLLRQFVANTQRFRSGEDGAEQRGCALGVGGEAHFEGGGFANFITDDAGFQRPRRETIRCLLRIRARKLEPGRARLPGWTTDDTAIHKSRSRIRHDLSDACGTLRRNSIGIQVKPFETV